jgi:hypothetical protein
VDARAQTKFEGQFVSIATLLGDEDRAWEPPGEETPEELFERQWKADTREAVRRSLEAFYRELGQPQSYEIFARCHLAGAEDQQTQEQLAAGFAISRDKVRKVLTEAKKRYERLFRQELRDQGLREEEIEGELRELV